MTIATEVGSKAKNKIQLPIDLEPRDPKEEAFTTAASSNNCERQPWGKKTSRSSKAQSLAQSRTAGRDRSSVSKLRPETAEKTSISVNWLSWPTAMQVASGKNSSPTRPSAKANSTVSNLSMLIYPGRCMDMSFSAKVLRCCCIKSVPERQERW